MAGDHQRGTWQAGAAERRRAGPGQPVDRSGPDRVDREGSPAAGQHVRWPGSPGDDPGGLRVAPTSRPRRIATEESPASADDAVTLWSRGETDLSREERAF